MLVILITGKYIMQNFYIYCYTSFLALILISYSCSSPSEPEIISNISIDSQLESDIANAILHTDGSVWTWGHNDSGQLGDGTTISREEPKRIKTLVNVVAIDLIEGAGVAADIEGNIWFWGDRMIWAEPPGYDTIVTVPKKISFLEGVKQMQVRGSDMHLLREDGTVWEVIMNHNAPTQYHQPSKIPGMENIKMISQDLALKTDGTLCAFPDREWVQTDKGGIGNEIISNVTMVQNAYMAYTIILKSDSTVWSWGSNKSGYLGNGTYENSREPIIINTLRNVVSISANSSRCMALKEDGTVWYWGLVFLDLDNNIKICENKPVKIEGLDNIKIIHASPVWDFLFMKNDGSYWSYNVATKEIKNIQLSTLP
jgi:alpha-tubulin suppressor-like RCC1 family protein